MQLYILTNTSCCGDKKNGQKKNFWMKEFILTYGSRQRIHNTKEWKARWWLEREAEITSSTVE